MRRLSVLLRIALPVAAAAAAALPARAQPRDAVGPPSSGTDTVSRRAASPPFPAPLASPLEARTRLAPAHVDRGPRSQWVGLVKLGEALPFRLLAPGRREVPPADMAPSIPALWGEVAGSVSSRFDLESNQNELIELHYRVGLRLRGRWGGLDARLELYHASSHLGDEYLQRTGRSPISTSREGLELLAAFRPTSGLRVYGGPGVLVRSTAGLDPGTARLGAEWRPGTPRWGPFRPYVSGELFASEELGWEPTTAAEAGVGFGDRFRLGLIFGAGPSRAEQFFRQDERLWGLSFGAAL